MAALLIKYFWAEAGNSFFAFLCELCETHSYH